MPLVLPEGHGAQVCVPLVAAYVLAVQAVDRSAQGTTGRDAGTTWHEPQQMSCMAGIGTFNPCHVPVHCSERPDDVVLKPALHEHEAAPALLALLLGHGVQEVASAGLNEPARHAASFWETRGKMASDTGATETCKCLQADTHQRRARCWWCRCRRSTLVRTRTQNIRVFQR